MLCPKCGLQISDGASICPRCGIAVQPEAPSPRQERGVPNLPRIPQDPLPERPAHNTGASIWQKVLFFALAAAVLFLVLYLLRPAS